ncbi:Broad specificity phosphatase PhoE [Nonomuraea solani]|uniref:Broad specificity phosphatase PhoE n=1 Tax=Nonomuraea solani TaxID=1144553 RepID=A0A1H6EJD1_9ACTN|nr:histidine phosphatase family protein [Nonomuraea solani]SEG97987.1 Broad specificity phosphatase PhoE [Nonomuraea solani]
MLFIRHATTPGMRAACFPTDENADPASLTRAATLAPLVSQMVGWVAPGRAAWESAVAMGLEPQAVKALAEVDCGRWRGLPYARIAEEEPDELGRWLADPEAAPHGGESVAAMVARVGEWLGTMRAAPDGVVVCDVGAIRAALGHALGIEPLGAAAFDLAPLSTTELTLARDGWRVAHVNREVVF